MTNLLSENGLQQCLDALLSRDGIGIDTGVVTANVEL